MPRTHRNAIRDPQILPDANPQVRRNASWHAFYGNCTRPTEQEKQCIDVSRPGRIRMHYVTRRYHRIQKHKLGVTSAYAHFLETAPGPPEPEK
jgi:hypothetical protein